MVSYLDWLDVGCGTGALSAANLGHSHPASLIALDRSEGFVARAQANLPDGRVHFRVGDAQALTLETASWDIIVSALTLNLVPDRAKALSEMRRVARTGGIVGFYVSDYPGGGVESCGPSGMRRHTSTRRRSTWRRLRA